MTTTASTARLSPGSPAHIGSIAGLLAGLGLVACGVYFMLAASTSLTLNISLIVMGIAEFATSFYTLKRLRVAWSFALSINGTAFVVFLFTAPRIRDTAEVSIGVALIPCLIFGAMVLMHSLHTDDF